MSELSILPIPLTHLPPHHRSCAITHHILLKNAGFGNDPKVMKQLGPYQAFLHPEEARSRGLAQGDCVRLASPAGEITLRVASSSDVPMGVILAHKGRWSSSGSPVNINALNPGHKADLAQSCAVHSINVTVSAVD